MAHKFERFIFDAFVFTDRVSIFPSRKEHCFSPLKKKNDIEDVKRAMVEKDRRILERITGHTVDNKLIELSLAFHYPTESLLEKWKGQSLARDGYIDV